MFRSALCVSLALMCTPAISSAQDFSAGLAAYEAGDYATALRKWEPLAEQGNARAQLNLGNMYSSGDGTPQDFSEAVKWYRKAAEQGSAPAQYQLGLMHEFGLGMPQDYMSAHMWLNLASGNGDAGSAKTRDQLAEKMTAEDISEAQQRARACFASDYQDCN